MDSSAVVNVGGVVHGDWCCRSVFYFIAGTEASRMMTRRWRRWRRSSWKSVGKYVEMKGSFVRE